MTIWIIRNIAGEMFKACSSPLVAEAWRNHMYQYQKGLWLQGDLYISPITIVSHLPFE